MAYWIMATIIIVGIGIVLLCTTVRIQCMYKREEKNDIFEVTIVMWRFIRIKKKIPMLAVSENEPALVAEVDGKKEKKTKLISIDDAIQRIEEIHKLVLRITGMRKIARRFLKHLQIVKFEWKSEVGTGDAATAGVAAGAAWSIKGVVLGMLSTFLTLKCPPVIHVWPNFQRPCLNMYLNCMVSFKIGHAIKTLVSLGVHWKKSKPKIEESDANV
ncbi:DUF2953 domain-containing protein [Aureibacillus halotolerans]|uniref:DUF2953 family protein n=1 Tax=Aureibacillus halotolerans TaxID=1508390 RepID=A0A4R6U7S2_9BACI|nr:DUF2953 domain-containing protein [Aureibacillus halotolerans]TDQ39104.1 DUF2953 family protein [Aureibacillus halotolerans]